MKIFVDTNIPMLFSTLVFSEVRIARSSVFYVVLCRSFFVLFLLTIV